MTLVTALYKLIIGPLELLFEFVFSIAYRFVSKTCKNVVVFMMDRSIGYYFPFLLEEKPVLQKQFEGFTYYPQTISYANKTNMGLPVIYGGYE